MELLLLGIYSFFAWLIFFKFKWLPWNIISQVITITLPIIGLTVLILTLNVVAPSSADVRVINYVVSVNPRVAGLVTEVPIVPNRPIKKGEVLFKIDPTPYELDVKNYSAQLAQLRAQLVTAQANTRNLQGQLKAAIGSTQGVASKLELARLRVKQFRELSESGAGNAFDLEQAQADVANVDQVIAAVEAAKELGPLRALVTAAGVGWATRTIGRDGQLLASAIKQSSGHALLDQAALATLARAAPFPPIPDFVGRETLSIAVPIDYALITD